MLLSCVEGFDSGTPILYNYQLVYFKYCRYKETLTFEILRAQKIHRFQQAVVFFSSVFQIEPISVWFHNLLHLLEFGIGIRRDKILLLWLLEAAEDQ